MKTKTVGEVKRHFSEVLRDAQKGEKTGILYGKSKKPVAMIVPYAEDTVLTRPLGILDGKMMLEFSKDFKMTDEELLRTGV